MKDTCKLALACAAMLALSSCDRADEAPAKDNSGEIAWARAALERNPNLDVVAVDADAGVFTVRDRRSGKVQTVNAADLAAAPVAQLTRAPAPRAAAGLPAPIEEESLAADEDAGIDSPDADVPDEGKPIDYTVERQGDKVRVSGPGVSIVSAGTAEAATARGEPGQRVIDPLICEGARMMQVDNRQIFVEGDAITARDGCELHITNSRIVASRTGVVVRDATVHITNSYIEGATGSYDAGSGAKLFLRGATLNGTMRRDPTAEIEELDGRWR